MSRIANVEQGIAEAARKARLVSAIDTVAILDALSRKRALTEEWGKEALLLDGQKVGRLTSGGYSVAFGKQIGMGYVRPDLAEVGTKLQVRINRELWDAVVVEDSPFDPSNARIRVDANQGWTDRDEALRDAERLLIERGALMPGDTYAITCGEPAGIAPEITGAAWQALRGTPGAASL